MEVQSILAAKKDRLRNGNKWSFPSQVDNKDHNGAYHGVDSLAIVVEADATAPVAVLYGVPYDRKQTFPSMAFSSEDHASRALPLALGIVRRYWKSVAVR